MLPIFLSDRFRFWAPIVLVTAIFALILLLIFLFFFKPSDGEIQTVGREDDGEVIVDVIAVPEGLTEEESLERVNALLLEKDPASPEDARVTVLYDSEGTLIPIDTEGDYVLSVLIPPSFDPGGDVTGYVLTDANGVVITSDRTLSKQATVVVLDGVSYFVWESDTPIALAPGTTLTLSDISSADISSPEVSIVYTPGGTVIPVDTGGSYDVSVLTPSEFDEVITPTTRYVITDSQGVEVFSGVWRSSFSPSPTPVVYNERPFTAWRTSVPIALPPNARVIIPDFPSFEIDVPLPVLPPITDPNAFLSEREFVGITLPDLSVPEITFPTPLERPGVSVPSLPDSGTIPTPSVGTNIPSISGPNIADPGLLDRRDPDADITNKTPSDGFIESLLAGLALTTAISVVVCLAGSIVGSLLPFWVSTQDGGHLTKECALDAIATAAVKGAAASLAASYIDWALTGFHGTPLFLSNPGQFWTDFADQAIGYALDDAGLGFLCDGGFEIDISAFLQLRYSRIEIEPPRCSLSDAIDSLAGTGAQIQSVGDDLENLRFINVKRIENTIKYGNPLSKINEADDLVRRVELNIGEIPTYRDLLTGDDETKLASFDPECVKHRDPADCQVYTSSEDIAQKKNKVEDINLDSLTTADELGEALISAMAEATVAGLLRRVLHDGYDSFSSDAFRASAAQALDTNLNAVTMGGFAATFYTGVISNDERSLGISGGSPNTKYGSDIYRTIFTRRVVFDDGIKLLGFLQSPSEYYQMLYNENGPPAGYRPSSASPDSYKPYTGGLGHGSLDYPSLQKHPLGAFLTSFFPRFSQSRTVRFVDCSHGSADRDTCEVRTSVKGYIYRRDLSFLGSLSRDTGTIALLDAQDRQIFLLERTYEATVAEQTELAGTADTYVAGDGATAPNLYLFQQQILQDYADKIADGEKPFVLARSVVREKFADSTAEVFVPTHLLIQLHECSPELDSSKLLVSGGIITVDGAVYRQTDCTLAEFRATVDTRLARLPREDTVGNIIHAIYTLSYNSGLITLPESSAADALTPDNFREFGRHKKISERYAEFGSIILGGVGDVQNTHFGDLSPGQARKMYIDGFQAGGKISSLYHTRIRDLLNLSS